MRCLLECRLILSGYGYYRLALFHATHLIHVRRGRTHQSQHQTMQQVKNVVSNNWRERNESGVGRRGAGEGTGNEKLERGDNGRNYAEGGDKFGYISKGVPDRAI